MALTFIIFENSSGELFKLMISSLEHLDFLAGGVEIVFERNWLWVFLATVPIIFACCPFF